MTNYKVPILSATSLLSGIVKAVNNVLSVLGLGTANQILGVNNAGTDHEYKTVEGTTNQVNVALGTANKITLSTPQDIHTGASPTFAKVNTDHIAEKTGSHGIVVDNNIILSGDIYSVAAVSWDGSPAGWDAADVAQVTYYKKVGKLVFIRFQISGTSTQTYARFTLPVATAYRIDSHAITVDAGITTTTGGHVNCSAGGTLVDIFKDCADATWTASGTKLVLGQFWYFIA